MTTTKPKGPVVKCPRCGRPQPKTLGPDGIYFCGHCEVQYDSEPDEGGSHFNDPSKRIELEDERRVKAHRPRR